MFEIAPQPRGQPLLVALGQFERGAAGPALAAAVLVVFAAEPAEHFARGNAAFELLKVGLAGRAGPGEVEVGINNPIAARGGGARWSRR